MCRDPACRDRVSRVLSNYLASLVSVRFLKSGFQSPLTRQPSALALSFPTLLPQIVVILRLCRASVWSITSSLSGWHQTSATVCTPIVSARRNYTYTCTSSRCHCVASISFATCRALLLSHCSRQSDLSSAFLSASSTHPFNKQRNTTNERGTRDKMSSRPNCDLVSLK